VDVHERAPSVTNFAKGVTVRWRSQSAGTWKEKTGEIVAVVGAREFPNHVLPMEGVRGKILNPGMPRDHRSYVVRADGRLYWPRVSALEAL
jgi:hypothetical protein